MPGPIWRQTDDDGEDTPEGYQGRATFDLSAPLRVSSLLVSEAISLAQLGWTAAREMAFVPHAAAGLVPGRIVLEHNHVYRVKTREGECLAEAAGRMKHLAEGRRMLPVVGDWVALRPDEGGRAVVREILPRHSAFSRKAAGRETEEQVVAANIDTILVVFGLDSPVKPRAIERYLAVARYSGADVAVVLNKTDLRQGEGELDSDVAEITEAAGTSPVIPVSMATGEGLDRLTPYLSFGKTVALIGPSGSGKSTMVNRLIGREELATGEVRDWDARGRHTSVHRQLVVREAGGLVIDTPGMRELQLWDTEPVAESFEEIDELSVGCRFRDCRHNTEPGCAVKAALEAGTLDARRYGSYLKLQHEQAEMSAKRDERALTDKKKREAKVQSKAIKAFYKVRRSERP